MSTETPLAGTALLRWMWRQLTSMRTALLLLLLLGIASIPGSLFPQRTQNPMKVREYLSTHGSLGTLLDRLKFFDVYSSPWFSAIYLLLFLSLIGCVLPRTLDHLRAIAKEPPLTPRNLDRMEGFHELAHGDLKTLLTDESVLSNRDVMSNLACQCMLAIATFHKFGYIHKDCHWGNFLYHKTAEINGYFQYKINDKIYYLKNMGYNIMIYDFGKAKEYEFARHSHIEKSALDYRRIANAFISKTNGGWLSHEYDIDIFTQMYMELLKDNIDNMFHYYKNEDDIIKTVLISLKNILLDAKPTNAKIINSKPFVIDDTIRHKE
mgnify:CR=1 FL=1